MSDKTYFAETLAYIAKLERDVSAAQSALKQANERAEKTEAANRRIVELLKEPSEGMLKVGGKVAATTIAPAGDAAEFVFSAMSAELLKEVNND